MSATRRAMIASMDRQVAIEMIARGLRRVANVSVSKDSPAMLWHALNGAMTYREYRCQRDQEYLTHLIAHHKSIGAAAKAAGVNRNTIYDIAKRCRFKLPSHPTGNRGNEAWQRLTAESRISNA